MDSDVPRLVETMCYALQPDARTNAKILEAQRKIRAKQDDAKGIAGELACKSDV